MATSPFSDIKRPICGEFVEIGQPTYTELISVRQKTTEPAIGNTTPNVQIALKEIAFGRSCRGETSDPFVPGQFNATTQKTVELNPSPQASPIIQAESKVVSTSKYSISRKKQRKVNTLLKDLGIAKVSSEFRDLLVNPEVFDDDIILDPFTLPASASCINNLILNGTFNSNVDGWEFDPVTLLTKVIWDGEFASIGAADPVGVGSMAMTGTTKAIQEISGLTAGEIIELHVNWCLIGKFVSQLIGEFLDSSDSIITPETGSGTIGVTLPGGGLPGGGGPSTGDNLLEHWTLDDSGTGLIGTVNNTNLSVVGPVFFNQPGKINQAVRMYHYRIFNPVCPGNPHSGIWPPTDNYLRGPTGAANIVDVTDQFTIQVWAKIDDQCRRDSIPGQERILVTLFTVGSPTQTLITMSMRLTWTTGVNAILSAEIFAANTNTSGADAVLNAVVNGGPDVIPGFDPTVWNLYGITTSEGGGGTRKYHITVNDFLAPEEWPFPVVASDAGTRFVLGSHELDEGAGSHSGLKGMQGWLDEPVYWDVGITESDLDSIYNGGSDFGQDIETTICSEDCDTRAPLKAIVPADGIVKVRFRLIDDPVATTVEDQAVAYIDNCVVCEDSQVNDCGPGATNFVNNPNFTDGVKGWDDKTDSQLGETGIVSNRIVNFVQWNATTGTMVFVIDGVRSAAVAFNASNAVMTAALEAMPNVGVGNATAHGGPGVEGTTVNVFSNHFVLDSSVLGTFTIDQSDLPGNDGGPATIQVPGSIVHDEWQLINLGGATSGSYTLTFDGQTTASILVTADGASVGAAIRALSNVGGSNATYSGLEDGTGFTGMYAIHFRSLPGDLGNRDLPLMTMSTGSLVGASALAGVTTLDNGGGISFNYQNPTVWDSVAKAVCVDISEEDEVRQTITGLTPGDELNLNFEIFSFEPVTTAELIFIYGVLDSNNVVIQQASVTRAELPVTPTRLSINFQAPADGIITIFFKRGVIGGIIKIRNVLVCDLIGACPDGFEKISFDAFDVNKGGWAGGTYDATDKQVLLNNTLDTITQTFPGLIPSSPFQLIVNVKDVGGVIIRLNGDSLTTDTAPGIYTLTTTVPNGGTVVASIQKISTGGGGGSPGGSDEIQYFIMQANGGTHTLSFGGETTNAIAYDATAAQIQIAMEALLTIGSGNILVFGGKSQGVLTGAEHHDPHSVESWKHAFRFTGTLAGTNVAAITGDPSLLSQAWWSSTYAFSIAQAGGQTTANEFQMLDFDQAVSGIFGLSFNDESTIPFLRYDATPQEVENAINALSTISPGVVVIDDLLSKFARFSRILFIEFTGLLGNTDVELFLFFSGYLAGPGGSPDRARHHEDGQPITPSITEIASGGVNSVTTIGSNDINVDDILCCLGTPSDCDASITSVQALIEWQGVPRLPVNFFNAMVRYTIRDRDDPLAITNVTSAADSEGRLGIVTCEFWKSEIGPATTILQTGLNPLLIGNIDDGDFDSIASKNNWLWSVPNLEDASIIQDNLIINFPDPPVGELIENVQFLFLINEVNPIDGTETDPQNPVSGCSPDPAIEFDVLLRYVNSLGQSREFRVSMSTDDLWEQEADFGENPNPWDTAISLGNGIQGSSARWDTTNFLLDSIDGRGLDQCTPAESFAVAGQGGDDTSPGLLFKNFTLDGLGVFIDPCDAEIIVEDISAGSSVNEIQSIVLPAPTGGTWTLAFTFNTTQIATLAWDVTAAELRTSLAALSNIGTTDNVNVTGSGTGLDPFLVEFIGNYAATDFAIMVADGTNLVGSASAMVSTESNGTNNERQRITNINGNVQDLIVTFGIDSSVPIPFNSSLDTVQSAIEGISSIGVGNALVTGNITDREANYTGPYFVDFIGALAATNVITMTASPAGYAVTTDWNGGLAGGQNEKQLVTVVANAGAYKLRVFDPNTIGGSVVVETISDGGTSVTTNEILGYTIRNATGGTYTLTFQGATTTPLPYNASASLITTAFEALSTVGAGNAIAYGGGSQNVPTWFRHYIVFTGDLANTNFDNNSTSVDSSGLIGDGPDIQLNHILNGGSTDRPTWQIINRGQPSGGTFTLSFNGQIIPALAWDIPTGDLGVALSTLNSSITKLDIVIGAGHAGDFGVANPGNTNGDYMVAKFIGSFLNTNVANLVMDDTNLTGQLTTAGITQIHDGVAEISGVQHITVFGASGTFTLSDGTSTTLPIEYGASAATIKERLETDIASIITVTVTGTGEELNPYIVTYVTPAGTSAPQLVGDGSLLEGNNDFADTELIVFDATANTVKNALVAAASFLSSAELTVTQTVADPINGLFVWRVEFTGLYAQINMPQMLADSATLSGGTGIVIDEVQDGSGNSDKQRITIINATGGTFKLTVTIFGVDYQTTSIVYNTTAAGLQAQLTALEPFVTGDLTVTAIPLTDPNQQGRFNIVFKKKFGNVPPMVAEFQQTLLCNPLILAFVPPGPYNYEIPFCDDIDEDLACSSGPLLCVPGEGDEPIEEVICCDKDNIPDSANLSTRLAFQRDLFDPNSVTKPGCTGVGGKRFTIRDMALSKGLNPAEYVPYFRNFNTQGFTATSYSTPIDTKMNVILIENELDTARGHQRVKEHLRNHREILPSRFEWPECDVTSANPPAECWPGIGGN